MRRRAFRPIDPVVVRSRLYNPVEGVGRSLIALAQASVLAFSIPGSLVTRVGNEDLASKCSSVQLAKYSIFCSSVIDLQSSALLCVCGFLVVACGIYPRITSVIHLALSFSLMAVITLPDGGDWIAYSASVFFVLVHAGDRRRWHWLVPNGERSAVGSSGALMGVAWAGMWLLKLQASLIYFNSATAKFAVEAWRDGSEMYYVSRMEFFGSAGVFGDQIRAATAIPVVTLMTSWGAIALELTVCVLILMPGSRASAVALALSTVLHIGIIVSIGIVSFGITMIGLVACATSVGVWQIIHRNKYFHRLSRRKVLHVNS